MLFISLLCVLLSLTTCVCNLYLLDDLKDSYAKNGRMTSAGECAAVRVTTLLLSGFSSYSI